MAIGALPVGEGVYAMASTFDLWEIVSLRPHTTYSEGGPSGQQAMDVMVIWLRREELSFGDFFDKGYGPFCIEGRGYAVPAPGNIPDDDDDKEIGYEEGPQGVPSQTFGFPLDIAAATATASVDRVSNPVYNLDSSSKRKRSLNGFDDEIRAGRTPVAPSSSNASLHATRTVQQDPDNHPTYVDVNRRQVIGPSSSDAKECPNVAEASGHQQTLQDDDAPAPSSSHLVNPPDSVRIRYAEALKSYTAFALKVDNKIIMLPRSTRMWEKGLALWEKAPMRQENGRHVWRFDVRYLEEIHPLVAGYLIIFISATPECDKHVAYFIRKWLTSSSTGPSIPEAICMARCVAKTQHPRFKALFDEPLRVLPTLKKVWATVPPRSLSVAPMDNVFFKDPTHKSLKLNKEQRRAIFETAVILRCVQLGMPEESARTCQSTDKVKRFFLEEAEILFRHFNLTEEEITLIETTGFDPSIALCRDELFQRCMKAAFMDKRTGNSAVRLVGDPRSKFEFDEQSLFNALAGFATFYGGFRRMNKRLKIAPHRKLPDEVPDLLDENDEAEVAEEMVAEKSDKGKGKGKAVEVEVEVVEETVAEKSDQGKAAEVEGEGGINP